MYLKKKLMLSILSKIIEQVIEINSKINNNQNISYVQCTMQYLIINLTKKIYYSIDWEIIILLRV